MEVNDRGRHPNLYVPAEIYKYEDRFESYLPPRDDKYRYYYFSPEEFLSGTLLAQQIQALSYVNMQIVHPESLITVKDEEGNDITGDDGEPMRIIAPAVTNPSGVPYIALVGSRTEYALGLEKGTTDLSPLTGRMVAWRRFYAPLDALPAFQFCKDGLWPEGEQDLRRIEADPTLVLAEPEALGKTENAGSGVIKEFIRAEIQRALGKGEVWFMGLVEKTVYRSWVHNWGPTAVRQVGEPKKLVHPHNVDDVALVPTIMDIDNFYANMANDILTPGNKSVDRQLANFVYMSDGVSDARLGRDLATFRSWAQRTVRGDGEAV